MKYVSVLAKEILSRFPTTIRICKRTCFSIRNMSFSVSTQSFIVFFVILCINSRKFHNSFFTVLKYRTIDAQSLASSERLQIFVRQNSFLNTSVFKNRYSVSQKL